MAAWFDKQGCHLEETHVYAGEKLPDPPSFDWLVVMGGPMSVHDEAEFPWLVAEKALIADAIRSGKAVLGICLGAQLISNVLGGKITRNREKEIGWFPIEASLESHREGAPSRNWIRRVLPETMVTFHWHGETFSLPEGTVPLFRSEGCDHQGFALGDKVVGLQFHPEMERSGIEKLASHCAADRKPGRYVQQDDAIFGRADYFDANRYFLEELLTGLRHQALKA
jgi:GMP synthase-like glutamine amidotransferase